jgi:hypothetical protein
MKQAIIEGLQAPILILTMILGIISGYTIRIAIEKIRSRRMFKRVWKEIKKELDKTEKEE